MPELQQAHGFKPCLQVTRPAAENRAALEKQYCSLTSSGIHVTFFNDNGQVGYVSPAGVKPFEHRSQADNRHSTAKLRGAVREANAACVAQKAQQNKRQRRQ